MIKHHKHNSPTLSQNTTSNAAAAATVTVAAMDAAGAIAEDGGNA